MNEEILSKIMYLNEPGFELGVQQNIETEQLIAGIPEQRIICFVTFYEMKQNRESKVWI